MKLTNLYSEGQGSGKTILLLHGFCETQQIWEKIIPLLSENHKVISLDLPGFGNSESFTFDSIEDIGKEIVEWIHEQGIQNFTLIGHSLGGYIALEITKLIPNKITHFILFHSTPLADTDEKKSTREKAIQIVKKHRILPPMKAFIEGLFNQDAIHSFKSEIKQLTHIAKKTKLGTYVLYNKAMKERKDNCEILAKSKFPKLILAGAHDQIIPIESLINLQGLNQNINLKILEHSGHMGMIEEAELSAKYISEFILNNGIK